MIPRGPLQGVDGGDLPVEPGLAAVSDPSTEAGPSSAAEQPTAERPARPVRFARVVGVWASVRPRTRRGAILAVAAIVAGSAVLAVAVVVGAAMAWSPYLETDLHPAANAAMWASQELSFAGGGRCAACHETETARAATAGHANIACESCHGGLLDHVGADTTYASTTIKPALPDDSVCIRCHAAATGRPAGLPLITTTDHYVPLCLECHDPHTAIAQRPPVVLHPLADLPACITCHGPDGFKARSQRHPIVEGDEPCLACHAPGRGPEPPS